MELPRRPQAVALAGGGLFAVAAIAVWLIGRQAAHRDTSAEKHSISASTARMTKTVRMTTARGNGVTPVGPPAGTKAEAIAFGSPETPDALSAREIRDNARFWLRVRIDFGRDVGQSLGTIFEAVNEQGDVVCGAGFNGGSQTRRILNQKNLEFFLRTDEPVQFRVTDLGKPEPTSVRPKLAVVGDRLIDFGSGAGRERAYRPGKGWGEISRRGTPGWRYCVQLVRNRPLWWVLDGNDVVLRYDESTIGRVRGDFLCGVFYRNRIYVAARQRDTGIVFLHWRNWSPYQHRPGRTGKFQKLRLPFGKRHRRQDLYAMHGIEGKLLIAGGHELLLEIDGELNVREIHRGRSGEFYAFLRYYDDVLLGHVPSGFLYRYDGSRLSEVPDFPPLREGQYTRPDREREAQSICLYRGELCVGTFPWGHVWRRESHSGRWVHQRLFRHPPFSGEKYPYLRAERRRADQLARDPHAPPNARFLKVPTWGQRIMSLVPLRGRLAAGLGKMDSSPYHPYRDTFLSRASLQEYGTVRLLELPYSAMGQMAWSDRPSEFEFIGTDRGLYVLQDGVLRAALSADISKDSWQRVDTIRVGRGAYGALGGQVLDSEHRPATPRVSVLAE